MSKDFNKHIKKWLDGDFRRSDEDALRQAVKEDAFVRDAMDGFYGLPEDDHVERLASLRKKIRGGADVPMRAEKTKPKWWAMAAALAFLLAAVWFMQNNDFTDQKTISDAIETKEEPKPNTTETTIEKPSTAASNQSQASSNAPLPSLDKVPPKAKQQQSNKPVPPKSTTQTEAAPAAQDYQSAPIAAAPVSTKETAAIPTDMAETPSNYTPDDAAVVSMEEVAKDNIEETANTTKNESLARAEAKAKKKESAKASRDKSTFETDRRTAQWADSLQAGAYANAIPPEPTPLMGWDDFRRYLRINARLTEEAMNNNVSGTVRVRFGINQMGEPINIVVIKSLGYGCDEEAKRLIEEGGEWQLGQRATVTVDVEFRR